jgi:hypothetical protein
MLDFFRYLWELGHEVCEFVKPRHFDNLREQYAAWPRPVSAQFCQSE